MTGKNLLRLANIASRSINAPFSTRDDCIQEACLFILEKERTTLPESFILRQMYQQLLKVVRKESRMYLEELPEVQSTSPPFDLAHLKVNPSDGSFLRTLMENNFNIRDSAEALGIPRSTCFWRWKNLKISLRRRLYVPSNNN